jgi:hypothetical protein
MEDGRLIGRGIPISAAIEIPGGDTGMRKTSLGIAAGVVVIGLQVLSWDDSRETGESASGSFGDSSSGQNQVTGGHGNNRLETGVVARGILKYGRTDTISLLPHLGRK